MLPPLLSVLATSSSPSPHASCGENRRDATSIAAGRPGSAALLLVATRASPGRRRRCTAVAAVATALAAVPRNLSALVLPINGTLDLPAIGTHARDPVREHRGPQCFLT